MVRIQDLLVQYSFDIVKIVQSKNRSIRSQNLMLVLEIKSDTTDGAMASDEISESSLRNYSPRCAEIERNIEKIIHDKLSGRDKFIIWGVGTHTQRLLGSGLDFSKILYFVDSTARYIGEKLNGIEVKCPADIREKNPILLSTYSCQQEIAKQIRSDLKLKNEIIKIF